ncbi:hypothetical protein [Dyella sp. ASV21]|uniref:hypothetical protein n=1 Tax=Dyella sp. ASV21 TaxID=2795114 RepID=UPI0018EDA41C|nr:hypothetical protein [Dyella sp. ASV21]
MTCVQIAGLASAILGAIGTIILFFASFSLQPLEGAVWGGPAVDAENERIRAKNASRARRQRIGLALLCGSFFIQAVGVFL